MNTQNKIEKLYLDQFNSDLSHEELKSEAEKTLYKIGEVILKNNEVKADSFFCVPGMCITKADIMTQIEGVDINSISDDDMQFIANKMSDMILGDFEYTLEESYNILQSVKQQQEELKNEN